MFILFGDLSFTHNFSNDKKVLSFTHIIYSDKKVMEEGYHSINTVKEDLPEISSPQDLDGLVSFFGNILEVLF